MLWSRQPEGAAIIAETARYAAVMLAAGVGLGSSRRSMRSAARGSAHQRQRRWCFSSSPSPGLAAAMPATGSARALAALPALLFLAGLQAFFDVLAITAAVPHFGVGNAVFFDLLGQMISAAAIDPFGLFGAGERPVTVLRAGGIALMAARLAAIRRAR